MAKIRLRTETRNSDNSELGIAVQKKDVLAKVYEHGESVKIPIDRIKANQWNPNEMSVEQFNMLSDNVDKVKFLQPILVVPLPREEGELQMFRIVDGEHRFETMRINDEALIPCIVADPEIFDEATQRKQTVRMNMIKGKVNVKKLATLVDDLIENFGQERDEIAYELGFPDSDIFQRLLDQARESLPNEDMKQEFDKARKEIKTVDDLSIVLNRLFTEYGDTLPANFMVLDFGGKQHLWVRMRQGDFPKIRSAAKRVMEHGKTFDSFLALLLATVSVDRFMESNLDKLDDISEISDDSGLSALNIDDLT